jgi:hypothetical protein
MMEYTAEFWTRAQELADKRPRACEKCGQEPALPKGKFRGVVVRLCYTGPDIGTARPDWLHLFCMACHPAPQARPARYVAHKLNLALPFPAPPH